MNQVAIINQVQADEVYRRLPKRSKLIFALGIETGLRVSDILWLRIRDIENPMSFPISRTRSVIKLRLPDWLYYALIMHTDGRDPDAPIFRSTRGKRGQLHRTTYHRDLKQAVAELDFSCSAHSTRKLYFISRTNRLRNSTR